MGFFGNSKPRLPELFQVIQKNDDVLRAILKEEVTDLTLYRAFRTRQKELSRAAEAFIKKQRGN